MKVVELFAGTQSCSKVARELEYNTWTTDWDGHFNCDLTGDILDEKIQDQIMEEIKDCDMVWMSPECTKWSLSAGNTYWTKYRMPKRKDVYDSIKMMLFCRFVADYCIKHNKLFFIENPNGRAVWIMDNQYLKRCWYCQYGDTRAKPTNLWTNIDMEFRTCFNGNPNCHHESAPRGSKTGTQGLKGNMERSVVPRQLCVEILDQLEKSRKRSRK